MKNTVLLYLQIYELFKLVRHGFSSVVEMQAKTVREIHVPTRVRLWTQYPNYVAVIKDEHDEKFLEKYVGKTITLEIEGVYVSGTLIKVKHGRRHDLEVVLPKRLKPMWEILRRRGIEHDAVVIIQIEGEEEVV